MNQQTRVGPISMNKPVAAVWRPPSQVAAAAAASPHQTQLYQSQHYQPQQYHHQAQPVQYHPQYQSYQQQQQQHQFHSPSPQHQPATISSVYQYQPASPHTASTFAHVPSSPRAPTSYYHPQQHTPSNAFTYPQHQMDDYQQPVSYQYQPSISVMAGPTSTSTAGMPSSLLMMNTGPSLSVASAAPTSPRLIAAGPISPAAAAPPAPPPPPPAPPLPASFSSINNYRATQAAAASSNTVPHDSRTSGTVPDALLKALNTSPMGKKPFTYTPGGLDLSHVRQSARVRRYESMNSGERIQQQHQQHHVGQQNFSNSYESYQKQSTSQTNLNTAGINYNYTPPGGVVAASPHSPMSTHQRLNSSSMNSFEMSPATAAPPPRLQRQVSGSSGAGPMGFNVTPEQLARSKNMIKQQQEEPQRDMYNQSFSFKMLNKWIAESETQPIQLRSKKDEEEEQQQQQIAIKKSEVARAIEEEERRGFVRSSQSPQSGPRMNVVPSRTFQYVDRKFSESDSGPSNIRRSSQPGEDYYLDKPPAREREQEDQPQRYRGTNIPSRAFKYLQYLTQNELVTDEKPQPSSDQLASKPALGTATVEAAPERLNALGRKTSIEYQQQQLVQQQATLNHYQQQQALKSMNTNAVVTAPNPDMHANSFDYSNINVSAEPKVLGVKSMMNRFNNMSTPSQTQPSYNRQSYNSTSLLNNTETVSAFHNSQPSPPTHPPSFEKYVELSPFPPANEMNARISVEKSEPRTSPLPSSVATFYEATSTDAAAVATAAAFTETIVKTASLLNGDGEMKVEETSALVAKVEIAETIDPNQTTINDSNSISLTPSASIANNETINTDINLNDNDKNEQRKQEEANANATIAAESQKPNEEEKKPDGNASANVQEEQQAVQEQISNETSNEVAQEVIETSEF